MAKLSVTESDDGTTTVAVAGLTTDQAERLANVLEAMLVDVERVDPEPDPEAPAKDSTELTEQLDRWAETGVIA